HLHGGYTAPPERPRRRLGADRRLVQGLSCQARRGLGGHLLHEIARRGREFGTSYDVSKRAARGRLAALRTERPLAQGAGGDARSPRKGTRRPQSAEGGKRRLLRYRFRADVSPAQGRRNFL